MIVFGNSGISGVALHIPQTLYFTTASVGNGADTTEDTLQTYTLPASTLKSNNDRLRIICGGTMAASTDTKTARVKLGGFNLSSFQGTSATQTSWSAEFLVVRTGLNTQLYTTLGGGIIGSNTFPTRYNTMALTETNTLVVLVTGQNSTTSTASSITCGYLSVEYIH